MTCTREFDAIAVVNYCQLRSLVEEIIISLLRSSSNTCFFKTHIESDWLFGLEVVEQRKITCTTTPKTDKNHTAPYGSPL
jgi:hypothetical protein